MEVTAAGDRLLEKASSGELVCAHSDIVPEGEMLLPQGHESFQELRQRARKGTNMLDEGSCSAVWLLRSRCPTKELNLAANSAVQEGH